MYKKIAVRQGCKMLLELYQKKNDLKQMGLATKKNSLVGKQIEVEIRQLKDQIRRLKSKLNSLYPDFVFELATCREIMVS